MSPTERQLAASERPAARSAVRAADRVAIAAVRSAGRRQSIVRLGGRLAARARLHGLARSPMTGSGRRLPDPETLR